MYVGGQRASYHRTRHAIQMWNMQAVHYTGMMNKKTREQPAHVRCPTMCVLLASSVKLLNWAVRNAPRY